MIKITVEQENGFCYELQHCTADNVSYSKENFITPVWRNKVVYKKRAKYVLFNKAIQRLVTETFCRGIPTMQRVPTNVDAALNINYGTLTMKVLNENTAVLLNYAGDHDSFRDM
jgi:hypothetical protein